MVYSMRSETTLARARSSKVLGPNWKKDLQAEFGLMAASAVRSIDFGGYADTSMS